jgi:hypothetical protein
MLLRSVTTNPVHTVMFRTAPTDLDLKKYCDGWQVQARCSVEGAADGRNYSTTATPYLTSSLVGGSKEPGGPANIPTKGLPFAFTLYAFVDLDAQDDEYVNCQDLSFIAAAEFARTLPTGQVGTCLQEKMRSKTSITSCVVAR